MFNIQFGDIVMITLPEKTNLTNFSKKITNYLAHTKCGNNLAIRVNKNKVNITEDGYIVKIYHDYRDTNKVSHRVEFLIRYYSDSNEYILIRCPEPISIPVIIPNVDNIGKNPKPLLMLLIQKGKYLEFLPAYGIVESLKITSSLDDEVYLINEHTIKYVYDTDMYYIRIQNQVLEEQLVGESYIPIYGSVKKSIETQPSLIFKPFDTIKIDFIDGMIVEIFIEEIDEICHNGFVFHYNNRMVDIYYFNNNYHINGKIVLVSIV